MKTFFDNLMKKIRNTHPTVRIISAIFIILAILAALYAHTMVADFFREMTILDLPGAPVVDEGESNGQEDVPEIETVGQPTEEPWDGSSRINILFLGLDFRDWESGQIPRSDTMILFTIDPITNTAGMISIPRDLWVNIPGFGHYKINEAYFLGESNKLPGGGPALASETVEHFIGVPIHYYAQVDFMTFIDLIDEIGGVLIVPEVDVVVEEFGADYEQTLKAGEQYVLPGSLALSYARNRYSGGDGDFGRARRQQQVIQAIIDRILKFNQLPELIAKAPALYEDLSSGIRTNLDLSAIIKLANLVLDIPIDTWQKEVIGTDMVIFARSPEGLDILKPIPDKIRSLRDRVFNTGGTLGPNATTTQGSTLVRDEAATVALKNSTLDATLSTRTAAFLEQQGMVTSEAGADQAGGPTKIFIYNSKPHTVAYLANLMSVASTNIRFEYDPNAEVDIFIVLGSDWAANNNLP